ncbi:MAG: sodium-dependent transporter [Bacteroidales bacterium]|nr:sodium-dependent transporter [Bacteroidales bacterium]
MARGRGNFGSRFAVVMALAGSAIGLGNIWRFPYMVGQHGGAAFILVYVVCVALIALPIFFAESIIGKTSGSDTFGAMEKCAPGTGWKNAGYIAIAASFVVVSFYSVVGGWSVDYLARALTGGFSFSGLEEAATVFGRMNSSLAEPMIGLTIFLGLTALILASGVDKGIETFSKITMPLLFLMIILIVARSVTLPGAGKGLEYLLKPDFSKLDGKAIAAALGQAFFSLSLGVGAILTYSSYMRKEENILYAGIWSALFDTLFALMASFAIMPAVFVSGLTPGAGPSLVFETLPVIFSQMGVLVPIIFFFSILIAALTSSISMMEVVVSWLVDQKKLPRPLAAFCAFAGTWCLGALCAIFPKVFAVCDFTTSNILMMFGAFVFALVVGWKMSKTDVRTQFTNYGTSRGAKVAFPVVYFLIKYIAPVMIAVIAFTNLF